jgi:hypothetical protein
MSILFPAKKQETYSGFLLAGNGPVQLFRFRFKFHCRFFDIFHDCHSSAPADAYSAMAANAALILYQA